jgi:hypothetical protein
LPFAFLLLFVLALLFEFVLPFEFVLLFVFVLLLVFALLFVFELLAAQHIDEQEPSLHGQPEPDLQATPGLHAAMNIATIIRRRMPAILLM